ncbi:MAG: FecR domain-containing protein [Alphaproteobacteria bacterium]|jgi:hypothetical protein|nr:FecR domain-containing protein [Alphaproteobacteria bacterium]MDP6518069.1 FecR domain-containing protein [Alphaproteobacteria bacterium]
MKSDWVAKSAAAGFVAGVVAGMALTGTPTRAEGIGTAISIDPFVVSSRGPGHRREIAPGDTINAGELFKTGPEGAVEMEFLDETTLRLGPDSELVLDSFVFDPAAAGGDFAVTLAVGALRLVSGNMQDEDYQVQSSIATIGIRGTDFTVLVAVDQTTDVIVHDGLVEVAPIDGGPPVLVSAGQRGSVSPTTGLATVTQEDAAIEPDEDEPASGLSGFWREATRLIGEWFSWALRED